MNVGKFKSAITAGVLVLVAATALAPQLTSARAVDLTPGPSLSPGAPLSPEPLPVPSYCQKSFGSDHNPGDPYGCL